MLNAGIIHISQVMCFFYSLSHGCSRFLAYNLTEIQNIDLSFSHIFKMFSFIKLNSWHI